VVARFKFSDDLELLSDVASAALNLLRGSYEVLQQHVIIHVTCLIRCVVLRFGNPGGLPVVHAVGREVDLGVAGVGHLRRVLGNAMGRKRRDRSHNHHGLGRRGNVVERRGVLPLVLRQGDPSGSKSGRSAW
jgi:hypothetical protein